MISTIDHFYMVKNKKNVNSIYNYIYLWSYSNAIEIL